MRVSANDYLAEVFKASVRVNEFVLWAWKGQLPMISPFGFPYQGQGRVRQQSV